MGPLSLDAFRKNNLSASWRVAEGDASVAEIESQVRIFMFHPENLWLGLAKVFTKMKMINSNGDLTYFWLLFAPLGKTNSV